MKIALYSGYIPTATFIENLIRGLAGRGVKVYLFGRLDKKVSYPENVHIYTTPENKLSLLFFVLIQSIKLFFKDIKGFKRLFTAIKHGEGPLAFKIVKLGRLLPIVLHPVDVFHIQWAKTIAYMPEMFSVIDCPIALSLRGAHINYSPYIDQKLANTYRKYFPAVAGFHGVSKAIIKEAENFGADPNRVMVIYSGVNEKLLELVPAAHIPEGKTKLISIGRFHWKKGYQYALSAVGYLRDRGIDVHYTIIAKGEVPEEILFQIHDCKLKDNVTIIPGLPHDKVISELTSSHILLLPSLEEGIANVVLEAMSVGVVVISTDCGGMKEVIEEGETGFIVPARNSHAMADKVEEVIALHPDRIKEIRSKAKEKIIQQHHESVFIESFLKFYKQIIKA